MFSGGMFNRFNPMMYGSYGPMWNYGAMSPYSMGGFGGGMPFGGGMFGKK
jgi:hypothetical protein